MRLLVLGGTGFVGRAVCDLLVARSGGGGSELVVPSRQPQRARHLMPLPGVLLRRADVHDAAQLAQLLHGCDAVLNLVAILHGSPSAFARTHVALPTALVQACRDVGVRRVVHVSALGAGPDAPSRYLRSKAEGEAVLARAGLDVTVLRPSVIFGAHDRFLNLFADLQRRFPVMPLAAADARFQPVWVNDVAAAVARCLADRATIGHTYELAGPRVHTLRQLVEAAGRWSGHPRHIVPLPPALGRLQAWTLEHLPGPTLMSRDNLDSMRVANVASGQCPGLAELGIEATPLESVAPAYLGDDTEEARLDAWRANHR